MFGEIYGELISVIEVVGLILTNFQSGFSTVVLDEENRVCQILYIHLISKWCVLVFFIHKKTHNLLCTYITVGGLDVY